MRYFINIHRRDRKMGHMHRLLAALLAVLLLCPGFAEEADARIIDNFLDEFQLQLGELHRLHLRLS